MRKYITGLEWDNFFRMDDERYILKNNKSFLTWYRELEKDGFYFKLNLEQMQNLIDKIALFFEFKYPDNMLLVDKREGNCFNQCKGISKKLDINQLKYRFYNDYVSFLECNYQGYLVIRKKKKLELYELGWYLIQINNDGTLNEFDLVGLKEECFIDDITGIKTVEDLLVRFREEKSVADYSEVEKCVWSHQVDIQIRNAILRLIPFRLIYSSTSSPLLGYERAKSFMRMFHQEYGIYFDMEELEEILNRDYTKHPHFYKIKQRY